MFEVSNIVRYNLNKVRFVTVFFIIILFVNFFSSIKRFLKITPNGDFIKSNKNMYRKINFTMIRKSTFISYRKEKLN